MAIVNKISTFRSSIKTRNWKSQISNFHLSDFWLKVVIERTNERTNERNIL